MSISAQLQASARAAYRSIYRAAHSTFAGDPEIFHAFMMKTRNDFVNARTQTDTTAYAENVKFANEVAEVLRKNIVQGKLQEDGVYNLRITSHTELGSNETIKSPPIIERPSRARRRAQSQCGSSPSKDNTVTLSQEARMSRPLNYSTLKKVSRERIVPELREEDLEEKFVKGRGPGGQCINKRNTNVDLLHKPSGIRVQCQDTRSLQDNRRIARKLVLKKLDALYNPGLSKEEVLAAKVRERKRRREKKARKRASETNE